jgi:hypothetical protein
VGETTTINIHVWLHHPDEQPDPKPDATVEAALARYLAGDPESKARQVHEAMTAAGWTPQASSPTVSYIRHAYQGTAHRVVLYLTGLALGSRAERERAFARTLLGATVVGEKRTRWFHSGPNGDAAQAIQAAEVLRKWADGYGDAR